MFFADVLVFSFINGHGKDMHEPDIGLIFIPTAVEAPCDCHSIPCDSCVLAINAISSALCDV